MNERNKHKKYSDTNHTRTDYIESRLSSRAASRPSHSHDAEDADTAMTAASSSDNRPRAVQPTRQGKIVEVDLSSQPLLPITGDESRKRKASTSLPPAPRWRNTRASDDVKRDQIVEAFLHENKCTSILGKLLHLIHSAHCPCPLALCIVAALCCPRY